MRMKEVCKKIEDKLHTTMFYFDIKLVDVHRILDRERSLNDISDSKGPVGVIPKAELIKDLFKTFEN